MLTDDPLVPLILVVESDENHTKLIQRSFETASEVYRLTTASSLREAFQILEKHTPLLVVTDFRLADGDGSRLIELAQNKYPVVILTAQGSERLAVESIKTGAIDYVVKSVESFAAMPRIALRAIRDWSLIQKRLRAEAELARSRAELKTIYDHAPVMMCLVDANRRVLYANPAFTAFTDVSGDDLIGGQTCDVFGCIDALDDPRGCGFGLNCPECTLRLAIEDTLKTGTGHHNIEKRTTLIRGDQLHEVVLLGSTAPIQVNDRYNLLLCLHDITGRKKTEEELVCQADFTRRIFNSTDAHLAVVDADG
ncbi:MAG: response regulator [Desulfuromonadales bacterium]|nr:response regulator [Desulfuromonadales bacterium]